MFTRKMLAVADNNRTELLFARVTFKRVRLAGAD